MTTESTEFAASSDSERRLRGFGPLGLLAIAVILAGALLGPIVASLLVLAWAALSGTPLRALGFTTPRNWTAILVGGAAFGIAFKLAMKAIVMPLLGAPPINPAYHYLAGNSAALPGILFAIVVGAGVGEEIFFRGYVFERLGALLGRGKAALAVTVVVSAALFGSVHYPDQGLPGVQQAAVVGLVFGAIFARRQQIWLLMVAHTAFDLAAVAIIYWNLEEEVAQFVFG